MQMSNPAVLNKLTKAELIDRLLSCEAALSRQTIMSDNSFPFVNTGSVFSRPSNENSFPFENMRSRSIPLNKVDLDNLNDALPDEELSNSKPSLTPAVEVSTPLSLFTEQFHYVFAPILEVPKGENFIATHQLPTAPKLKTVTFNSIIDFLGHYENYRRQMTDIGFASRIIDCISPDVVDLIVIKTGTSASQIWNSTCKSFDIVEANIFIVMQLLKAARPVNSREVIDWFTNGLQCKEIKGDSYNSTLNITQFINKCKRHLTVWTVLSGIIENQVLVGQKPLLEAILSKLEPKTLREDAIEELKIRSIQVNSDFVKNSLIAVNKYLINKITCRDNSVFISKNVQKSVTAIQKENKSNKSQSYNYNQNNNNNDHTNNNGNKFRNPNRPNAQPNPLACPGCGHTDCPAAKSKARDLCRFKDKPGFFHTGARIFPIFENKITAAITSSSSAPTITGYINNSNREIVALLDSGSDTNLVSSKFAANLTIVDANPISLKFGNGDTQLIKRFVSFNFYMPDIDSTISITAGIFNSPFDVIIGHPTLLSSGLGLKLYSMKETNCLTAVNKLPSSINSTDLLGEEIIEFDSLPNEIFPSLGSSYEFDTPIPSKSLPEDEFNLLSSTIHKYKEVFNTSLVSPAFTEEFKIDLTHDINTLPYKGKRQLSPLLLDCLKEKINELLANNIIKPSVASYASPILMVKQNNSYRMCIDYTDVNKITMPLVYPLPNSRTILQCLKGQKYFAKLDLKSGYHQLKVSNDTTKYTSFVCELGQFEFNRLPFGLSNAPSFFQNQMATILVGLIFNICFIYIDDIIIFAKNIQDLNNNVEQVFSRLRSANLRCKGSKCEIGITSTKYLGFIVDGNGISHDPTRISALNDFPTPKTIKQLRSFLGLCNYFRDFVKDFARIAKPLYVQTGTDKRILSWNNDLNNSFINLKSSINGIPTLHHINYEYDINLQVDASILGVGAYLFQINNNGIEEPISFASHAFNEVESRWPVVEQECFALYFGVTSFEHYLLGAKFSVYTDHKNLCLITSSKSNKMNRWRLALQSYNFKILYIKGSDNFIADTISRCFTQLSVPNNVTNDVPTNYDINPSNNDTNKTDDIYSLISKCHNHITGHVGINQTIRNLLLKKINFPNLRKEVTKFVHECPICQKCRPTPTNSTQFIEGDLDFYEPFEEISIDCQGRLPTDNDGNSYLINIICNSCKFVELFATKDITAKSIANCLLAIVGRYGPPKRIRCDNAPTFSGTLISELTSLIGTNLHFSIEYRPQSNAIIERVNGEIIKHLSCLINELRNKDNWSHYLPLVQRIINASVHKSIGYSPSNLLYGSYVNLNRQILNDYSKINSKTYADYINDLYETQSNLLKKSNLHLASLVDSNFDKKGQNIVPTIFPINSYVLVNYPNKPPTKLSPKLMGPFRVINFEESTNLYQVQDLLDSKLLTFHVSRLIKFNNNSNLLELSNLASLDKDLYLVEKILSFKGNIKKKNTLMFEIKWLNFDDIYNSYLPLKDVINLIAFKKFADDNIQFKKFIKNQK